MSGEFGLDWRRTVGSAGRGCFLPGARERRRGDERNAATNAATEQQRPRDLTPDFAETTHATHPTPNKPRYCRHSVAIK